MVNIRTREGAKNRHRRKIVRARMNLSKAAEESNANSVGGCAAGHDDRKEGRTLVL